MKAALRTSLAGALCAGMTMAALPATTLAAPVNVVDPAVLGAAPAVQQAHYYRHWGHHRHYYRPYGYYRHHYRHYGYYRPYYRHRHYGYYRPYYHHRYYRHYGYYNPGAAFASAATGLLGFGLAAAASPFYGWGYPYGGWGWGGWW